jgi:hypothetical protein
MLLCQRRGRKKLPAFRPYSEVHLKFHEDVPARSTPLCHAGQESERSLRRIHDSAESDKVILSGIININYNFNGIILGRQQNIKTLFEFVKIQTMCDKFL